jgi:hypothetical protein
MRLSTTVFIRNTRIVLPAQIFDKRARWTTERGFAGPGLKDH